MNVKSNGRRLAAGSITCDRAPAALSADGKAMKHFGLVPFGMRIAAETALRGLAEDGRKDALQMEESDQ